MYILFTKTHYNNKDVDDETTQPFISPVDVAHAITEYKDHFPHGMWRVYTDGEFTDQFA